MGILAPSIVVRIYQIMLTGINCCLYDFLFIYKTYVFSIYYVPVAALVGSGAPVVDALDKVSVLSLVKGDQRSADKLGN